MGNTDLCNRCGRSEMLCDCPAASPPQGAPADEYERLKRQKDAIIERQERALVDAAEKILFWRRHAHECRNPAPSAPPGPP